MSCNFVKVKAQKTGKTRNKAMFTTAEIGVVCKILILKRLNN
jgi:hypothetical protein